MCLYPKLIENPKYKPNKKNGGIIPAVLDKRIKYVPIGCQECKECRKKKASEWKTRLHEEIKHNTNGKFVTLTFSNESIRKLYIDINSSRKEAGKEQITGYKLDNEIATRAVRLFLERWRKQYKRSVRHWLVTELGHNGTENVHIHGLIWTDETPETINKIWKYGYTWVGKYVNGKTINYIAKYVTKQDKQHPSYMAAILTSAGIGSNYTENEMGNWTLNKFNENGETQETYITKQGLKSGLPIYYRNKIYTEEQRELLWIQKLDKNERWLNGVKIDVSTHEGMMDYLNGLKEAQAENIRLGYGNGANWENKKYENQLREINMMKRIQIQNRGD